MKRTIKFIKGTIIEGVFLLVPLTAILLIVKKLWEFIHTIGTLLAKLIGIKEDIWGIRGAVLVTIILTLLLLFTSGLLFRVKIVGGIKSWIDLQLLKYIPGYDLYKANIEKKVYRDSNKQNRQVVLININNIGHFGLIMEILEDGRNVVFVPNKPDSDEGKTYIVHSNNIELLSLDESVLFKLMKQGKGWGKVINN